MAVKFLFLNLCCSFCLVLTRTHVSSSADRLSDYQLLVTLTNSVDTVPIGPNGSSSVPVLVYMDEDPTDPGSILYMNGNASHIKPYRYAALMKYAPHDGRNTVLAGSLTARLEYTYPNNTSRYLTYQDIFVSENASLLHTINTFTSYDLTKLLMAELETTCVLMLDRETGKPSPLLGNCTSRLQVKGEKLPTFENVTQPELGKIFPADQFNFCEQTVSVLAASLHNKSYAVCMALYRYYYIIEVDMVQFTGKIKGRIDAEKIFLKSFVLDSSQTVIYALSDFRYSFTYDILKLNVSEHASLFFITDDNADSLRVIHQGGEVSSSQGAHRDGLYSSVGIGSPGSIRWLIQDEVLIAGDESQPTIRVIDLKRQIVSSYCLSNNSDSLTLVGSTNRTECVDGIYFDQLLAMSDNETMYFTTIGDRSEDPTDDTPTLYKTTFSVSECDDSYLNTSLLFSLESSHYRNFSARPSLGSRVTYTCPKGLYAGLENDYRSLDCLYDLNTGGPRWTPTVDRELKCLSLDSFNMTLSRSSGARFGGYEVTVIGVFPPELPVDITLVAGQSDQRLNVTRRNLTTLSFLQPDLTTAPFDLVTIYISMPGNNMSFNFELTESPVFVGNLPSAINPHFNYDLEFAVDHIDNSDEYSLAILRPESPDTLYTYECDKRRATELNQHKAYGRVVVCHLITHLDLQLGKHYTLALRAGTALMRQRPNIVILGLPEISQIIPVLQPILENNQTFFSLTLVGRNLNQSDLQLKFSISLRTTDGSSPGACNIDDVAFEKMSARCVWTDSKTFRIKVSFLGKTINETDFTAAQPIVGRDSVQLHTPTNYLMTIVPASLTLIVIIILAVIIYYFVKLRRRRHVMKPAVEINEVYISTESDGVYLHMNVNLVAKISHMTIPREKLELCEDELLGKGYFGEVYKGRLHTENGETDIAAKSLKGEASKEQLESLIEEARMMYQFRHEHVLSTLGVCFDGHAYPIVVLPYMAKGDLKAILLTDEKFTTGDLLHFGLQICKGMDYLHCFRYIHRDLAARNCLVSDGYVVKVADFGLSREIYKQQYYKMSENSPPLPVKWMAPESLATGLFTHSSDVWSFGVVLWELFSRGRLPYADVDPFNQRQFLEDGRRLEKPDRCPEAVYRLMNRCWSEEAEKRLSFKQLVSPIRQMLSCGNPDADYHRVFTKDIKDGDQTTQLKRPASETGLYALYVREAVRDSVFKALMMPQVAALKLQAVGRGVSEYYSSSETDLLLRAKAELNDKRLNRQCSISMDERFNIPPSFASEFLTSISDNNLQDDSGV